jgi:hypothetical protein
MRYANTFALKKYELGDSVFFIALKVLVLKYNFNYG